MEADKEIRKEKNDNGACDESAIAKFYLSTAETLARYAYEASARQQQMNLLAQLATVNSVNSLYAAVAPEAFLHRES